MCGTNSIAFVLVELDGDLVAFEPGVQLEAGEAEEGGGPRRVAARALQGIHNGLPLEFFERPRALGLGRGRRRAGRRRGAGRRGRGSGDGPKCEVGGRDEDSSEVIRRRSMAFRSSRMLPRQGWRRKRSHASRLSVRSPFPIWGPGS